MLLRKTRKVGIFRPVISTSSRQERDKTVDLLLSFFRLDLKYEETFGLLQDEAVELIVQDRYDDFMTLIIQKFKALETKCDFVLCIGSDYARDRSPTEFDINADIAKNLSCPVLVVTSAAGRSVGAVVNSVSVTQDAFVARGCQLVGAIVNRATPEAMDELCTALERLPHENRLLSVIPAHPMLSSPTMSEVADHLHAEVLYGADQLDRIAYHNLVVAMRVENFLAHLSENALLITPGDRSDVILTALQAHKSVSYPQIAGIVLTGGMRPVATVERLLTGSTGVPPIMVVAGDTYTTVQQIEKVRPYITTATPGKIELCLELFEEHVDIDGLGRFLANVKARGMTPKMFIYNIIQQAKSDKRHVVLPEGNDERILRAAEVLLNREIVDLTILGEPEQVRTLSHRLGLSIDFQRTPIIQPETSPRYREYAQKLYELRKERGVNLDMALDWMRDVSYFGTMMVYLGHADAMVSGAAHTTQHTIRPALQFVKTRPGVSVVSSVFFMCLEDRVLVYGDCAVNPNPTAEQLAEIAISSADTARAFGIEPLVAMLSYSTGESGKGEEVEKVRLATQIARERRPDLLLDGPIQYDAAVDETVARLKMPGSPVAGKASVLIFPDLNTGNNTYKAVQRETGAIAMGPVLQGLNKPVNDLSRGCTVDDIINTVAITAIQAQGGMNG
jgi:phosphate acetyltransferase